MSIIKSLSDFSPLNEDNMSGLANAHPWQEIERMVTVMVAGTPIQLTGNLFKTGSSVIDTNSTPFQDAIGVFKKLDEAGYKGTLVIRGSASAVGQERGFDNMALARKRAENFWKAVQKWFNNTTRGSQFAFVVDLDAMVGTATVPNSKEALAEQCVYLIWVGEGKKVEKLKFELVQPIDNTAVAVNPIGVKPIILDEGGGSYGRCGCCGRDFSDKDKTGWVMDRYNWALNELKNGWLKSKPGTTVWEWLTGMSNK